MVFTVLLTMVVLRAPIKRIAGFQALSGIDGIRFGI